MHLISLSIRVGPDFARLVQELDTGQPLVGRKVYFTSEVVDVSGESGEDLQHTRAGLGSACSNDLVREGGVILATGALLYFGCGGRHGVLMMMIMVVVIEQIFIRNGTLISSCLLAKSARGVKRGEVKGRTSRFMNLLVACTERHRTAVRSAMRRLEARQRLRRREHWMVEQITNAV